MKVVLDTNVIVSRFLSAEGASARVLRRWRSQGFDLLVSDAILAEYHRALSYEKVRSRHRLSDYDIAQEISRFEKLGLVVQPSERLRAVPDDPKDDMFVECAVAGEADYIVSGDAHLLALREYRGIRILSPAVFLAVLEREGR